MMDAQMRFIKLCRRFESLQKRIIHSVHCASKCVHPSSFFFVCVCQHLSIAVAMLFWLSCCHLFFQLQILVPRSLTANTLCLSGIVSVAVKFHSNIRSHTHTHILFAMFTNICMLINRE